jgi:hypothetical protein
MLIAIPKKSLSKATNSSKSSFDVPEGHYRAKLLRIAPPPKFANRIRLVYEIQTPSHEEFQYLAGKNYRASLASKSILRQDLKSWRGHDLTEEEMAAGSIGLEKMIGREADVEIRHVYTSELGKPFVELAKISPPGTWVYDSAASFTDNSFNDGPSMTR